MNRMGRTELATKSRNYEKPIGFTFVFSCFRATPLAAVGLALTVAILAVATPEAHKPITSKYTYNDDVFPILRDRCARCHVTGGVSPMTRSGEHTSELQSRL